MGGDASRYLHDMNDILDSIPREQDWHSWWLARSDDQRAEIIDCAATWRSSEAMDNMLNNTRNPSAPQTQAYTRAGEHPYRSAEIFPSELREFLVDRGVVREDGSQTVAEFVTARLDDEQPRHLETADSYGEMKRTAANARENIGKTEFDYAIFTLAARWSAHPHYDRVAARGAVPRPE